MRARKKKHGGERFAALSALLYADSPRRTSTDGAPDAGAQGALMRARVPFARELPLRLEIGCGKGGFIRTLSELEPDRNFIALERVTDVLVTAMEQYALARGIARLIDNRVVPSAEITPENAGNVRFLNTDAALLGEVLAPASIEGIYLNFSDPWVKKGYYKRRLTYVDFLRLYAGLLENGGFIAFKTDNEQLYDFSLEQLAAVPELFEVTATTRDLHASEYAEVNIMTEYERAFSAKGAPIYMLRAVRKPRADS